MSDKLRLFIAVHFSAEVDAALGRLCERLRTKVDRRAQISWVAERNVHLTLQFLGDVDQGLLPKLAGSLSGAYHDVTPFEVAQAGVGAFPSPHRARVIWAGVRQGADGLRALHAASLKVTEGFGFEPEQRPFQAHVTLGRARARGRRMPDLSGQLDELAEVEVGACQIGVVSLVRSVLEPGGPVYTNLDSFPLGR